MSYKTSDICLATILLTVGYRFMGAKAESRRTSFCFETDEEFEIDIRNYWNNRLKLPAKSLLENFRMLLGVQGN